MFRSGQDGSARALPLSGNAQVALHLHQQLRRPVLCVTDGPLTLDALYQDLTTLAGGEDVLGYYPGWESLPREDQRPRPDIVGDRLLFLQRMLDQDAPGVTVTTIQALMQRTIEPDALRAGTFRIACNDEFDLEPLAERLQSIGYTFELQVTDKGEASLRGGILDLWPCTEPWPLRIEFFGSTVDSIRTFDPNDQRSIDRLNAFDIPPASEWSGSDEVSLQSNLFAYLPANIAWLWLDPNGIRHHAEVYEETILEMAAEEVTHTYRRVLGIRAKDFRTGFLAIGPDREDDETDLRLDIEPLEGLPSLPQGADGPDLLETERKRFVIELLGERDDGFTVRFFLGTEGARDRFLEQFPDVPADDVRMGRLSEGFRIEDAGFIAVAESDLYGQRKELRGRYDLHAKRKGPSRMEGERVAEWSDLEPGELVVHVDHGIGKYLGLYEMEFQRRRQEVLTLEYHDGARLHLPVTQAHLLSRYVGVGGKPPRLHKMGGRRWANEKIAVEQSVQDLAAGMLETQATRELREGTAFAPDTPWQHEFEAAFPFQETPDQHAAIVAVKADMERARPMDRLVCGDVGYGKTEVAMRAAFKAVMNGKQVAILVPTTILAQQHYDSFSLRMAAFPFTIEMLSRFQTRGAQNDIVRRLPTGSVDIVIGTHRLIQDDIAFKDLGLLIIDEEQRFGVAQKEKLKQIRQLVDVLTLTATPIPRTLYMSLLGTRDMSTIQSPPQERLPIETVVGPTSDDVIRRATLRELNRGGQVYFLHNRVATIEKVGAQLTRLVPEARIAIGHGQMHENELAQVMRDFIAGEYDVLLCTTIIESGVDIPNVNTILIDRADRFGLSELYQLRGRVGRYKHQAYAYLLLPKGGRLIDGAKKRIAALTKYSSLGAGFKLALKDLEIRGTGNLLGSEQSGQITTVGFELYCQFLKRTVARMKGEKVPPLIDVDLKLDFIDFSPTAADSPDSAVIPIDYITDEDMRVHAYRKLATTATEPEVDRLQEEFADRFGPPPPALLRRLKLTRIRILAALRRITLIETREEKIMLTRNNDYIKDGALFPRFKATKTDAKLDDLQRLLRKMGKRKRV